MSLHTTVDQIAFEQDPFGAKILNDGSARFRFWSPLQEKLVTDGKAPDAPQLILPDLNRTFSMNAVGRGWYETIVPEGVEHGARYALQIWNNYGEKPGWMTVPDPMSYWQEKDIHGYSRVVDTAKLAKNRITWNGVAHEDLVLEQVHIGAFTDEGTFKAAMTKLPYLASVGFTAIQLMPIEATAAKANWGYDGVLKGAIQPQYGTPEDFAEFVNEAHRQGIAVLTDQVFNHFAAIGNYIELHTPQFFKYDNIEQIENIPPEKRKALEGFSTPWGTALDLSRTEVRKFIEQLEWHNQVHYGTDGVRRDAVHGLKDDLHKKDPSIPHILTTMTEQRKLIADDLGHPFHVINEDEYDRPTLYAYNPEENEEARGEMQWGDNFHHALFVAVTKDHVGKNNDITQLLDNEKSYYHSYYEASDTDLIAETVTTGNAFSLDTPRNEKTGEEDINATPDVRTKVVFPTNHDHIGNTPLGLRLRDYLKDDPYAKEKVKFVNTLTAWHPGAVPQFFMGQSWGSRSHFPFFAIFDDENANQSYRDGRKKELSQFDDFVDPASPETFKSAKLDWDKASRSQSQIDEFKNMIDVRRKHISPHIASGIENMTTNSFAPNGIEITTQYGDGAKFVLAFNAGNEEVSYKGKTLKPWGVAFDTGPVNALNNAPTAVPA